MNENVEHFIGEEIEVHFDKPPVHLKTPHCPNAFTWQKKMYPITERISEWSDF